MDPRLLFHSSSLKPKREVSGLSLARKIEIVAPQFASRTGSDAFPMQDIARAKILHPRANLPVAS
jgi:hypothetical protein